MSAASGSGQGDGAAGGRAVLVVSQRYLCEEGKVTPDLADRVEAEAVAAVRNALSVVMRHRLAEVEITLSSDRSGVVHLRQVARLPLGALVEDREP